MTFQTKRALLTIMLLSLPRLRSCDKQGEERLVLFSPHFFPTTLAHHGELAVSVSRNKWEQQQDRVRTQQIRVHYYIIKTTLNESESKHR